VKIIPMSRKAAYEGGILVFEANVDSPDALDNDLSRNLILRVDKHNLRGLGKLVQLLVGKFKRLNLHLIGTEYFTEADLAVYEAELGLISRLLAEKYMAGVEIEVNVLTDRMLLQSMNNCDAGVQHITVAPNNKCYICPGFYYDDENNALGDFAESPDLLIENRQLLTLPSASICSRCDAFQCKRCLYLNQKTTMEINIPAREQCVISHIERDIAGELLTALDSIQPFQTLPPVPTLPYRDPICVLTSANSAYRAEAGGSRPAMSSSDRIMAQILATQARILHILQNN